LLYLIAIIVAATFSGASLAAGGSEEGIVLEIGSDAVKIAVNNRPVTYKVCEELLTNTVNDSLLVGASTGKFTDLKKGCKIQFESENRGGEWVVTCLQLHNPDDAGVVTEVGKDTIRNDKGRTTAYKVVDDLAGGTRTPERYSKLYPSKFSEVTKGCRIEVLYYKVHDDLVICGIDVKKEKEKEK
jgi:hypothetical protein